jgi:hypothetical protein
LSADGAAGQKHEIATHHCGHVRRRNRLALVAGQDSETLVVNEALPFVLMLAALRPGPDPLPYAEHVFPDQKTCRACLEFNCKYQQHLRLARDTFPRDYWQYTAILEETHRRYAIWDALEDVQTSWFTKDRRRERLAAFRELIGEDAYRAGAVPFHVPLEAFTRIDP